MSLINNYLKKASQQAETQSRQGSVPPVLLAPEKTTSGRLPYRYISLAILCLLGAVGGYLLMSSKYNPLSNRLPDLASQGPSPFAHQHGNAAAPKQVEQRTTSAPAESHSSSGQVKNDALRLSPAAHQDLAKTTARQTHNIPLAEQQAQAVAANVTTPAKPAKPRNETTAPRLALSTNQVEKEKKPVMEPLPITADEAGSTTTAAGERKIADYFFQLGLQAQLGGDLPKAEQYYRQVLDNSPDHIDTLINLSAIYIQEDRLPDARELLDTVLALDPGNAKALVNQGLIAMHGHQNDQARAAFEEALRKNPSEKTALTNLAYMAQQANDIVTADHYYKKLIKIDPDDTRILLAYANLLEQHERFDEAIALYRQSLKVYKQQDDMDFSNRIKNRIGLLQQYKAQKSYKKFFKDTQGAK